MKRIIAIDYGNARIGLARTDSLGITAQPIGMIKTEKSMENTIAKLLESVKEHGPFEKFVIGLPLHLNGKESDMSLKVRKFASLLEIASELPVELFDERLTSMQVESLMKSDGQSRKKRAEHIDTLSATVLLQTFLARHQ